MGSALASINEVTLCLALLVLRWLTAPGFNFQFRKPMLVYNPSSRLTQPGHPSVGSHNEYHPEGVYALQLGSKGRYGS